MSPVTEYNYSLAENMLERLNEEFGARKIASKFYQATRGKSQPEMERLAQEIFEDYGREWIRSTVRRAEEHHDRTYQVLKAAAESTGLYRFGIIPQRFLEIAYLAIQDFPSLPILECNAQRLRYQIADCTIFRELREKCGDETVRRMPCRHACLSALRVLHEDLGIDAVVSMPRAMVPDGCCQFMASRALARELGKT